MIVGWTGHRPELFRDPTAAQASVEAAAREQVAGVAGVRAERFLVGGQRGVDTWAALAAIRLGVPFVLILPLEPAAFSEGWSPEDRSILDETLARAQQTRIAGGYAERNRLLAAGADLLNAVWTGLRGGGTAETIGLARAAGTPVREIRLERAPTADAYRGRGL